MCVCVCVCVLGGGGGGYLCLTLSREKVYDAGIVSFCTAKE